MHHPLVNIYTIVITGLWVTLGASIAYARLPFELRDSDPDSPAFRARFMASYGVNGAIEPMLSGVDRELFEEVMPFVGDNPARAIQILKSRTHSDSNAAFDYLLANLYYQQEQYALSEQAIMQALKKMPDFRRAWRTLALIYTRNHQAESAMEAWRKVIALGGGDAQSYGLLAYLLLSKEQYASAKTAYEQARLLNPESEDFKRGLVHCLMAMEDYRHAIALLDELIEVRPDEQAYWKLQANAFLAQEQYSEAIANLMVVTRLGDNALGTYQLLGDLFLNEAMRSQALEAYLKGLDSHAHTLDYPTLLKPLKNLTARRCFSEASVYLRQLDQKLGKPLPETVVTDLKIARARLKLEAGLAQEAIDLLKPVAELEPLNGECLMVLAAACAQTGSWERADFYYTRATLLSDYGADAHVELARLAVSQGKMKAALKHLSEAQKRNPQEHVARYLEQVKAAAKQQR